MMWRIPGVDMPQLKLQLFSRTRGVDATDAGDKLAPPTG